MGAKVSAFLGVIAFTLVSLFAPPASAAGSFKLKSTQVTESGGQWHIFVTLELSRPPATAHVPMKFLFQKEMVFERALIDGHDDPVMNRMALTNQTPSVESLDVDFADGSGKVYKGTRFDFSLTRDRGYEAGEYSVKVRTADGIDVGSAQHLTLNGDNPVVDRRAITFNAKDPSVKKVAGYGNDGGAMGPAGGGDDTDNTSTQSHRRRAERIGGAVHSAGRLQQDARRRSEDAPRRLLRRRRVARGRRLRRWRRSAAFALGLALLAFGRRRRG